MTAGTEGRPTEVRIEHVWKEFGNGPAGAVLEDLSLEVRKGELVSIVGPSGCGKSTLLNMLCNLAAPSRGEITFASDRPRIGYVFQAPRLLPWRSVRRNVEFSLEQTGATRAEIHARALEALRLVQLAEHVDKYPHQLSGGMQQRVALARALTLRPDVLLMDEPFGALDALTRGYLQEEVLNIVRHSGSTTLLVTHDIDEAMLMSDRVVVMSSRPAHVKEIIDMPFTDCSSLEELIADPEYPRLRARIRDLLRPEVSDLIQDARPSLSTVDSERSLADSCPCPTGSTMRSSRAGPR
jgi:NitT/TauT family transport system ATP-binding protein